MSSERAGPDADTSRISWDSAPVSRRRRPRFAGVARARHRLFGANTPCNRVAIHARAQHQRGQAGQAVASAGQDVKALGGEPAGHVHAAEYLHRRRHLHEHQRQVQQTLVRVGQACCSQEAARRWRLRPASVSIDHSRIYVGTDHVYCLNVVCLRFFETRARARLGHTFIG